MGKLYKFIGQDGSLGLRKYSVYYIRLRKKLFGKLVAYIEVGYKTIITCPYTNIKTFNENWEEI